MVRIFKTSEILAKDRIAKGSIEFGLQFGLCDHPLQIIGAFSGVNYAITSFKVKRIDSNYHIIDSITQNINLLTYGLSQYYFASDATFSPTLADGVYYFEFFNSNNDRFTSEIFGVAEKTLTGTNNVDDTKIFQDDNIYEFD